MSRLLHRIRKDHTGIKECSCIETTKSAKPEIPIYNTEERPHILAYFSSPPKVQGRLRNLQNNFQYDGEISVRYQFTEDKLIRVYKTRYILGNGGY